MRLATLFAAIVLPVPASGVDLVREERPVAAIVIPALPSRVESYAAKELQYHLAVATGAQVPLVSEDSPLPAVARVYLGHCRAAASAHIDPAKLPGNAYIVKTIDGNLYITGHDSGGDPLDLDTHEGTLFGVYDILENNLGVRWLWPGKLGEVIPPTNTISLSPADGVVRPLLWFKQWRGGASPGERVWLKRQRFGRSIQPQYGHSFGNYWPRFSQTHPEYFAMLPDGTRRQDPTSDPGPEWVHVCVSQPALAGQILADWKGRGAPRFLNVCENDGWAGCACPVCLSWDEPDPDNQVPFGQRLQAAQRAFRGEEGRADEWMFKLGSLSDRYARFWKIVSEKARQTRPDVQVVSYVYDNYRKAPVKALLNSNVLCGVVPQESIFGYSRRDSQVFRHDWSGWEKTGCGLFLRPNYTLQAPNFPAFYARTLGEDLKFAMAHGLTGTDFDSLTGKYSTQGPSLYLLAKILNHPTTPVDEALDEFYAAFGPARELVKQYFQLWESIYPNYSAVDQIRQIDAKRHYGAGLYGPFYFLAGEIYTPAIMSNAWSILNQAKLRAAPDAIASARLEWLAKGLQHADLILAAGRAYERKIDAREDADFLAARQKLEEFRAGNEDYNRSNFAGLTGSESKWH
ncbi:MAG TPA: DUF4838 domain-containing protein [Candidatus Saccharimonadales bacterium]|nr:DUF4838 domain-containing protein [Candidatus Saccharimonadales bacterium]